jgi:cobalt-zinc-cadmium efflux system membrane fusion protein
MNARPLTLVCAITVAMALVACGGGKADSDTKPTADKTAGDKPAAVQPGAEGHGGKAAEHGDGLKLSAEEAARAGIKLENLAATALADTVTVTATIRANEDRVVRIAPRVEGRVTAVSAALGEQVRAGQSLATLDSLVIAEAHSAWVQAQASYRIAESDFKRAEALNADEIIPKKEFLRAKSELDKAALAQRAAQDRLKLLGVATPRGDTAAATESTDSTFKVLAPFAGVVIEKKAALGQLATPAEPLFVLADLSRVWIEADLNEALLAKVRVGATATVDVPAYPGVRFTGKVTYLAAVLDKDKRTVPTRIEVDNRDGRLKPEMFVTATIASSGKAAKADKSGQAASGVLSVPDEAIVLMQGLPTVFVFEHEGYEQRAIEVGDKVGGRTVVRSGLAAGEQVVAAGAYALKARVLKSQISDEH